ncbi:tyrosine protein phosphatase [Bacillus sp. FJAT-49732]|uniref:Tyrosine-protein phosphatase n=1 Tax=Lederbergia citrisecunda TaxID=2833583 RepID=A0A942TLS6_9BACI|nr:CpsB/CapC family capsule biosynthesis tyrosine phosphatase [Lederbergia citrisecunda]MBS4200606.1 tyrosine protein phosphatase [Lederbergia citrisecunda]
MIDIHCHILPNVDDGASHFTDSLHMAKQAESEGIHTIIATPHHQNGSYVNAKKDIEKKVAELNDYLHSEKVDVHILPGQETRIYGELLEDYEAGEILTLSGISSYLFIELPSNHVPHYTDQLCYDMQMKGLIPVIVHPERNSELIQRPDKLYTLVKNGAATQITATSFAGYFGKKIQKFAFDLVESNLTHFIASDAHNTTTRGFKMSEAYDLLETKYGLDSVYYFMENAELIVDGKDIYREVPERIKRKKIFGLF